MGELRYSKSVILEEESLYKSGVRATMGTCFSSRRVLLDITRGTNFKTLEVRVPIIIFDTPFSSAAGMDAITFVSLISCHWRGLPSVLLGLNDALYR